MARCLFDGVDPEHVLLIQLVASPSFLHLWLCVVRPAAVESRLHLVDDHLVLASTCVVPIQSLRQCPLVGLVCSRSLCSSPVHCPGMEYAWVRGNAILGLGSASRIAIDSHRAMYRLASDCIHSLCLLQTSSMPYDEGLVVCSISQCATLELLVVSWVATMVGEDLQVL